MSGRVSNIAVYVPGGDRNIPVLRKVYGGWASKKTAGDRLRDLLDKYTTNPFMGLISGIVVTILLQSSTATTVLTIGLVNAGFMKLRQAIAVIMGANIGTTTTAFIIGLPIKEYSLPIMLSVHF